MFRELFIKSSAAFSLYPHSPSFPVLPPPPAAAISLTGHFRCHLPLSPILSSSPLFLSLMHSPSPPSVFLLPALHKRQRISLRWTKGCSAAYLYIYRGMEFANQNPKYSKARKGKCRNASICILAGNFAIYHSGKFRPSAGALKAPPTLFS